MRQWLSKPAWHYVWLAAAGAALRLVLIFLLPVLNGDTGLYGELARNWLHFGVLGTSVDGGAKVIPSLVRLPGYPAFLAAVWSIAGVGNYRAVLLVQAAFDIATCLVVADMARRLLGSERGARIAFLLAALCPFTANYAACALTETLSIFFAALALDLALLARNHARLRGWAGCGLAVAAGILLRPDSGILLAALLVYIGFFVVAGERQRSRSSAISSSRGFSRWLARAVVLCLVALAPLAPWTLRNWHTFGLFQPLAPRYANAPDEFVPLGWEAWVKTWMVDYVSVEEVYWVEKDEILDVTKLPDRAFDSADERARTTALFAAYNAGEHHVTPDLDRQFLALAQERIHRHPLRYYLALPALRVADMWLRPRTEMLGLSTRWWDFDPLGDSLFAVLLGILNLAYVAAACIGIVLVWRRKIAVSPGWGMLLLFIALRSLFLGTIENPEPRYTLECFPVVFVMATAGLLYWFGSGRTDTGDLTRAEGDLPRLAKSSG